MNLNEPVLVEQAAVQTLTEVTNLIWRAGSRARALARQSWDVALIDLSTELSRLWRDAARLLPETAEVHGGEHALHGEELASLVFPSSAEERGGDRRDEVVAGEGPRELLVRAEQLLRQHPVHAFPAGTGLLVVELIDLVRSLGRE